MNKSKLLIGMIAVMILRTVALFFRISMIDCDLPISTNDFQISYSITKIIKNKTNTNAIKIGMGTAITTRMMRNSMIMNKKLPFFNQLIPSFCSTCSPGFLYKFFLAYDFDDHILKSENGRNMFKENMNKQISVNCKPRCEPKFQLIKCNHSGKPALAQNDAMMEAYKQNMDYLYMVNDDTILRTSNWTNIFISVLKQMHPPDVGVVGPSHIGGKTNILTYNFVHKTHVDIFSTFYPPIFETWYADDWISLIYLPNNVLKVPKVRVHHTMSLGMRYKEDRDREKFLPFEVQKARNKLKIYLQTQHADLKNWFKQVGEV